jgi:phosphate transport system permease protein
MSNPPSAAPGPSASAPEADGFRWPEVSVGRKIGNAFFWGLCFAGLAMVIVPTIWLAGGVIVKALPHWHWSVLTTETTVSSSGPTGGIENAVIGTLIIAAGVIVIGGVISILTGLWLSEFAPARVRGVLRGGYEVLAGIPSIVLGFIGYLALCVYLHWGFGLAPAVLVLSVITIPYITKATESSLGQVPTSYREGAEALGLPPTWALRKIVLKSALPGIVTGILVALAIAIGETAPLLTTAGWSNSNPALALTHSQLGYLPYPIFNFYQFGSQSVALSYDSALILLVIVLILIIVGRVIIARSRRHAE